MLSNNGELTLLIRSKYPLIYYESVDENYAVKELEAAADELGLIFYQWSLTDGLRRGNSVNAFYKTKEPVSMLQMALALIKSESAEPGLYVLKDFEIHLENAFTLRLLKDAINHAKNTKNTFVILSTQYKLPKDLENDSARIIGGYPSDEEIKTVIHETIDELKRTNKQINISLTLDEFTRIINAFKGLSAQQIRNVLNQCLLDDDVFNIKDLNYIESCKRKIFDKEGLLEFYVSEDGHNLAGFDNLKRWLSERKDCFISEKMSSLPVPRGVLLIGVQGCGKSLAVKVIARELNLPLYRLDLSKLYSKYIGETEENLRKGLMLAEKMGSQCLWIDEIEKGLATSHGDVDGGVSKRVLGTFLTWMQEHKTNCFIAATANDIYNLPPEFVRKGRFDEILFVDLPDKNEREQLFKIHLDKRNLDPRNFDGDSELFVEISDGFSGAEIEQAIISALYRATSEKTEISSNHIVEQLKSTKPLSVLKREEVEALRNWAKERTIPV